MAFVPSLERSSDDHAPATPSDVNVTPSLERYTADRFAKPHLDPSPDIATSLKLPIELRSVQVVPPSVVV